ncbi:hypothetical protein DXT89_19140 [Agrobacterium vitis]|uniref:Uncharacterized protein n=1 Tax=Agrobacterium vitis TaxID=373 RepID=A0A368NRS9_AGRVI|nr:hypothetical protein DXM22_08215 [Agrobacterium vitis]KAA3524105.1 hypothetical protein DXT89_19140 [Agrobacterium vitis]RCU53262.1 hypothetical protein ASB66_016540 [Agrobacterium vitis]
MPHAALPVLMSFMCTVRYKIRMTLSMRLHSLILSARLPLLRDVLHHECLQMSSLTASSTHQHDLTKLKARYAC